MTKRTRVLIEIIGSALVLASAGWELFIGRPVSSLKQDSDRFRIENKLDEMWMQIAAIRQKIDPDPDGALFTKSAIKANNEDWKLAGDSKGFELINWQDDMVNWIKGGIFLLGSIMVLFARYAELESNEAPAGRPPAIG